MESHREGVETTLKALTELAEHKELLVPSPIDSYKMQLDRRWKALGKEVRGHSLCVVCSMHCERVLCLC